MPATYLSVQNFYFSVKKIIPKLRAYTSRTATLSNKRVQRYRNEGKRHLCFGEFVKNSWGCEITGGRFKIISHPEDKHRE